MNGRKIVILLIFIMGISLVILGGVYNPYAESIDLPQGGFKGIGFKMYSGEIVTYHLESFDFFTVYIMNRTQFEWLMNNGTFNGSYYTSTGKSMNLQFHVPVTGVYYIVVANFNAKTSIEINFFYQKSINWPLTIIGTLFIGVSAIFLFFEIRSSRKKTQLDIRCPQCGSKVSSSWNYCPYCRYELGGGKYEN